MEELLLLLAEKSDELENISSNLRNHLVYIKENNKFWKLKQEEKQEKKKNELFIDEMQNKLKIQFSEALKKDLLNGNNKNLIHYEDIYIMIEERVKDILEEENIKEEKYEEEILKTLLALKVLYGISEIANDECSEEKKTEYIEQAFVTRIFVFDFLNKKPNSSLKKNKK